MSYFQKTSTDLAQTLHADKSLLFLQLLPKTTTLALDYEECQSECSLFSEIAKIDTCSRIME